MSKICLCLISFIQKKNTFNVTEEKTTIISMNLKIRNVYKNFLESYKVKSI